MDKKLNAMKKLISRFLMISCKEATLFVLKKEERKLSLLDRIKLNVHTSMCAICKKFEQQSSVISKESRHIHTDDTLPAETRVRIGKIFDEYTS